MLGDYCRNSGDYVFRKPALRLAGLRIQPWMMNLCSVASAIASGYFFFSQNILLALLCLFFNGVFDYMDGGISRALLSLGKKTSHYGTTFHLWSDKLSEIAIFSGMIAGDIIGWDLGLLAIATCMILTLFGRWVKHKELFYLNHSLFDRADRLFVLSLFCTLKYFRLAVMLVSILNIVVIVQRLYSSIRPKSPQ